MTELWTDTLSILQRNASTYAAELTKTTIARYTQISIQVPTNAIGIPKAVFADDT